MIWEFGEFGAGRGRRRWKKDGVKRESKEKTFQSDIDFTGFLGCPGKVRDSSVWAGSAYL